MTALTVTSKGQITLKKELLLHLGVYPGDRVDIEKLPDGGLRLRATRPAGAISDVFGMLRRDHAVPVSIEEMNAAIAKGWAGER